MASIGIFKCDVCGKETRLDRTPGIERGKITIVTDEFQGFGNASYPDSCSSCAAAIYYGVLEIVENLRKKSA